MFVLGCKTEECEDKLKRDCKLYNINYNSLKLKYTYNKNAAWGSRDTCNNDGKLFQLPKQLKDEEIQRLTTN